MYEFIKKIVKELFPKQFLFKNELCFRRFLIPFYSGNNCECNICERKWKKFIAYNGNLLCPYCGSLNRTRRLYNLLTENEALQGNVLHFSPSRSLYRKFKPMKGFKYFAADFEGEFLSDYKIDITQINFPNETFDTIICYHILEHISEDEKAMKELFRTLKTGGLGFIQTPFKEGKIYEDFSIIDKSGRLKAFGQEDHIRIYSLAGLKSRLEKVGFKVSILDFENVDKPFGLKKEQVLRIEKTPN